jgi:hypothetical protein
LGHGDLEGSQRRPGEAQLAAEDRVAQQARLEQVGLGDAQLLERRLQLAVAEQRGRAWRRCAAGGVQDATTRPRGYF